LSRKRPGLKAGQFFHSGTIGPAQSETAGRPRADRYMMLCHSKTFPCNLVQLVALEQIYDVVRAVQVLFTCFRGCFLEGLPLQKPLLFVVSEIWRPVNMLFFGSRTDPQITVVIREKSQTLLSELRNIDCKSGDAAALM